MGLMTVAQVMTLLTGKWRGFTLVEVLVVLGIMGLLLGLSVPGLVSYAKQARLRAIARQTVGLVSLARSLAISTRQEQVVVVDEAGQQIRVETPATGEALEQVVRLPVGLSARLLIGGETPAQARFTFRSSGALSGRSVALVLSHAERDRTVTVTAATGAIALE